MVVTKYNFICIENRADRNPYVSKPVIDIYCIQPGKNML